MLKTKSPAIKKRTLGFGVRAKSLSLPRVSPVSKYSARNGSRQQDLTPLIRGLKAQITRLSEYLDSVPMTRDDELFFISQLHTLNVLRDKMELMKDGMSDADLTKISRHLGKKMQSSFSD